MAGKDTGSNSRKRKGGAPEKAGGKKRKPETKLSKQAKTRKDVSKKDKGKNQAKVIKQNNKATARTTVRKKGNTQATVSKQNGATPRTTVNKKGNTPGTVSKQKNKDTKATPAKTAKKAKKAEGTKKTAEPAKKYGLLKEGTPKDLELVQLGVDICNKWINLGRLLKIEEPKLEAINKDFDSVSERGIQMLKHWKQKQGSGASYKSLSHALKHNLVERKDLTEKYCFK